MIGSGSDVGSNTLVAVGNGTEYGGGVESSGSTGVMTGYGSVGGGNATMSNSGIVSGGSGAVANYGTNNSMADGGMVTSGSSTMNGYSTMGGGNTTGRGTNIMSTGGMGGHGTTAGGDINSYSIGSSNNISSVPGSNLSKLKTAGASGVNLIGQNMRNMTGVANGSADGGNIQTITIANQIGDDVTIFTDGEIADTIQALAKMSLSVDSSKPVNLEAKVGGTPMKLNGKDSLEIAPGESPELISITKGKSYSRSLARSFKYGIIHLVRTQNFP